jgi:hypothetical protein
MNVIRRTSRFKMGQEIAILNLVRSIGRKPTVLMNPLLFGFRTRYSGAYSEKWWDRQRGVTDASMDGVLISLAHQQRTTEIRLTRRDRSGLAVQ